MAGGLGQAPVGAEFQLQRVPPGQKLGEALALHYGAAVGQVDPGDDLLQSADAAVQLGQQLGGVLSGRLPLLDHGVVLQPLLELLDAAVQIRPLLQCLR